MIRALYGQAQALPASIFELGISPYINASIIMSVLLYFPADIFEFAWLKRLKEARKEGRSVSTAVLLQHDCTFLSCRTLRLCVCAAPMCCCAPHVLDARRHCYSGERV